MQVLRQDPTPNPDALKFILDKPIVRTGSRSFRDRNLAEHPVAKALFAIDAVESLFFVSNVITVTKDPYTDWSRVIHLVSEAIEATVTEDELFSSPTLPPVLAARVDEPAVVFDPVFPDLPDDEKRSRVERVLDVHVRPGLAMDGGGIHVVEILGRVIRIEYQGACGTCPSSTSGTLGFIQAVLRSQVHPELEVELA